MTKTVDTEAIGTAYIDGDGVVYRLRSFSRVSNRPDYTVHYVSGSSSMTRELPEDAKVLWTPSN